MLEPAYLNNLYCKALYLRKDFQSTHSLPPLSRLDMDKAGGPAAEQRRPLALLYTDKVGLRPGPGS